MDRRSALVAMATSSLVALDGAAGHACVQRTTSSRAGRMLRNAAFAITIDETSGALTAIAQPDDPSGMSWIGGPDNAPWQPGGSHWGLGFADLGPERLHRGRWTSAAVRAGRDASTIVALYMVGDLQVEVTRRLLNDALTEQYRFSNVGNTTIPMRGQGKASLAIYTPFNDHYTSTSDVLDHRSHAHVWAGGSSAWVATFRMGGRGPHLGMVLTEGALDGYSIEDRDLVTLSNTRGTFLLHPAIEALAPGQSSTIGWTLFWHCGWNDFFEQAQRRSRQMVRIEASRWTAVLGDSVDLCFHGALGTPALSIGKQVVPLTQDGNTWRATIPNHNPGEQVATLHYGGGLATRAVLNAVLAIDEIIAARVRFITNNQQWAKADDRWDGAYLVYDNDFGHIVRTDRSSDRIAGRERVGMGILVARWLRQGGVADSAVRASFDRFYEFVNERLQRADGYVLDGPDRDTKRLYNWPWIMHLHVEAARLTRQPEPVQRLLRTIDSYYREGGINHYPISLPISDSLTLLKQAGLTREHDRIRALFVRHGDALAARGTDYPPFEVNFEQSIVAPAAITLLDLHRATGDVRWLDAARKHVALLDLFEGRQPDHHLHGIAIRHWDGYWFGKARMWGDTFPHYWSTLNAIAWTLMARATGDLRWADRAATTLGGNLSLFRADGSASAAYIYPDTVNGRPGQLADPYANDQDWTLVHALQIQELTA